MKHPKSGPGPVVTGAFLAALLLVACGPDKKTNSNQKSGQMNKNTAQNQPAILFLGDSLTAGFGLPQQLSPPARVQKKIHKRAAGGDLAGYRVINGGVSGDTTSGGLNRLSWYLKPELKLKHIMIGLGSNDAMTGVPVAKMEKNLRAIIDKIRAFDSKIKIHLWQLYTFPSMGVEYSQDYAQAFARVANDKKVSLVPFPLKGVAGEAGLNQPDGIHPNEKGSEIVAENLWKYLKKVL